MGAGWAGSYPRPDAQAVRAEGGARPQVDQRESWGNTGSFASDSRLWDSLLRGAESKESRRAWEIARPPSLLGCGQEPREEAVSVGGFYFPPSKRPAPVMAENLLLDAAFGESQSCGKMGRAMQPQGHPPDPLAVSRQG